MQLTLDRFGRMVLPKAIRDDFGLRSGDILEAEEANGTIVLRPLGRSSCIRREGGALVFTGRIGCGAANMLEEVRQARMNSISGELGAS